MKYNIIDFAIFTCYVYGFGFPLLSKGGWEVMYICISATVPWARSGVFLGPSTEMTVGQRDCLTIWLSYCCIVGAPGPVSRVTSHDLLQPFFKLYFGLSFVSLFWAPGRPKRSIVANLAPKITPKWSLKWSQSDNGRPLRNMHRHCRIAHPPPFGELHFHCLFRVPQKVTKKHLKKSHF